MFIYIYLLKSIKNARDRRYPSVWPTKAKNCKAEFDFRNSVNAVLHTIKITHPHNYSIGPSTMEIALYLDIPNFIKYFILFVLKRFNLV